MATQHQPLHGIVLSLIQAEELEIVDIQHLPLITQDQVQDFQEHAQRLDIPHAYLQIQLRQPVHVIIRTWGHIIIHLNVVLADLLERDHWVEHQVVHAALT